MVKFDSVDLVARTATFDVDGVLVTRGLNNNTTDETLDKNICDLAAGLNAEFKSEPVLTKAPSFVKGEEVLAVPVEAPVAPVEPVI